LIEHLGYGHLNLGELAGVAKERTHNLAGEFSQCGVECRVVDNLMEERWRKLVWNVPFNGLTIAAGGITTADILRGDSLRSVAIALMNEVVVGAKSCGYNLPMDVGKLNKSSAPKRSEPTNHRHCSTWKLDVRSKSKRFGENRCAALRHRGRRCRDWSSFIRI
jgi:hypothetical protein